MFSARMTVSAAMMAVPGSMIITAVTVTNDLVYQTPRADLIILVQKKLKSFGLSQEEIVAFTTNTAIPLSLQVDAVKDLEALGNIPCIRWILSPGCRAGSETYLAASAWGWER
jgi:hypothetical protein